MDKFHIFLYFPTQGVENEITNERNFEEYIEKTVNLIDRADCEKGTELYYSATNKDLFVETLSIIADSGNFDLLTPETIINIILQYAEDWEENPEYNLHRDNCTLRLWDFDNRTINDNFPNVLKEITEKKLSSNEKCLLLNINNAFYFNRDFIPVFKDCRNNPINQFPKFVHIYFVINLTQLENWFINNCYERNLNVTDMRHQENTPQYIKGKSPLLYDLRNSVNQEKLKKLLKSAIGDQRESKDLINFDSERDCYIWFEYENDNPQNQYHCYHLVQSRTHEIDKKAEAKIPERVIKFLESRKNNS